MTDEIRQPQGRDRRSFLLAKVPNIPVTFTANKERVETRMRGEITLRCFLSERRQPLLAIDTFNLIADSIRTEAGESGRISITLDRRQRADLSYDHRNGQLEAKFKVNLHYPLIDRRRGWHPTEEEDNFAPHVESFVATLTGEFEKPIEPRPYEYEMLRAELSLIPETESEIINLMLETELVLPVQWIIIFLLSIPRRLPVRPVFIGNFTTVPLFGGGPTGKSFYPLIQRANEIWQKCCIQFDVLCPPRYIQNDDYRVLTADEADNLRAEVDEDDAIEIFVVERWDPEDEYGGGATWSSGTASAKIITADNQLPLNQNHLAHELGHVLGLAHPGTTGSSGTLVGGCVGSIMEPSGFYADNPSEQCYKNCREANNPLLCSHPHQPWCVIQGLEDEDRLF